jgi:methyl-accepting chemotaxis protein
VVRDSVAQEDGSLDSAHNTISTVLADFKGIIDAFARSSSLLKEESIGIQSEVNQALMHLQFQDRVSQIVSQVNKSISGLPVLLQQQSQQHLQTGSLQPLNAAEFLAELQKSYVMADQHVIHQGGQVAQKTITDISFY